MSKLLSLLWRQVPLTKDEDAFDVVYTSNSQDFSSQCCQEDFQVSQGQTQLGIMVLWVQNQLLDYGFNFMNTKIHIDNESTICIVKNPVYHSKKGKSKTHGDSTPLHQYLLGVERVMQDQLWHGKEMPGVHLLIRMQYDCTTATALEAAPISRCFRGYICCKMKRFVGELQNIGMGKSKIFEKVLSELSQSLGTEIFKVNEKVHASKDIKRLQDVRDLEEAKQCASSNGCLKHKGQIDLDALLARRLVDEHEEEAAREHWH
ncbi:hypothetical protein Tco_0926532 [Tanacetum coccineum]|uniref:Uncharacterized protein n=1 Tax=Tanacetum coccineum TaxID=301880 RepID=A0ABQ5DAW3_9ASTR